MTSSLKSPEPLMLSADELIHIENIIRSTGLVTDVAIVYSPQSEMLSRCSRCAISTQVSGIRLDAHGICNECRRYDRYKDRLNLYFSDRDALQSIIAANRPHKRSDIDCLLLFSGGKDSTYVLHQLLDMQLKVMTYTFDNGFISRQAFDNIERITGDLDIKHVTGTHEQMREVFRQSLKRHSTVCKGCFKALLDHSLILADQQGINLIFTGMSRGQIVEERLKFFHDRNIFDPRTIDAKLAEGRRIYHQVEHYAGLDRKPFYDDSIFDRVRLIDFYRYCDAKKQDIYDYLSSNQAGWKEPKDTGFCSSNCLINDVGVSVHSVEKGFSNYEIPTAWEVRLGHLDRDSALAELAGVSNGDRVKNILRLIEYEPTPLEATLPHLEIFSILKSGKNMADLEQAIRTRWPHQDVVPKLLRVASIQRDDQGRLITQALTPQVMPIQIPPPQQPTALSAAQLRLLGLPAKSKEGWTFRVIVTRNPLDQGVFRRALFQVLTLHPALRMQLRQTDKGVESYISPISNALPLIWADLSSRPAEQRKNLETRLSTALLSKVGTGINESLALFAVTSPNVNENSTLAIAVHRLVMDEASWWIMLRHLEWFYRIIASDATPKIPLTADVNAVESQLPAWVSAPIRHGARDIKHRVLDRDIVSDQFAQLIAEALSPMPVSILVSLRQNDDQRIGYFTGSEQLLRGMDPQVVIMVEHSMAAASTLFGEEKEVSDLAIAGGRSWLAIRCTASDTRLCWSADSSDPTDVRLTEVIHKACTLGAPQGEADDATVA
ncbi:hypothetical protein RSA46_21165 [Pseudomonas oryzihabitans]|nr:hypothetical protein SB5_07955 [Pseudomonas psychrotolerans]KTT42506.1 hypothetical protein RSA46_21165 [Pseudomonas psychrotolerans]